MNDLDVIAADIRSAYLQAPSSARDYIICCPEFGVNAGKKALIKRALYGGKTAGRDFWLHLRSCMKHLGFQSCLADPDMWMREGEKPSGEKYWEFVLLYTDDCLCISHKGESVLRNAIGKYFNLKEKLIYVIPVLSVDGISNHNPVGKPNPFSRRIGLRGVLNLSLIHI